MTKQLLAHFVAMQGMVQRYLPREPYFDREGVEGQTNERRDALFIGDVIYALDGPEQRAAQAHAEFDYIGEASRTMVDDNFNGDMATAAAVREVFNHVINAGNRADVLKKAWFYRRGNPIGLTNAKGAVFSTELLDRLSESVARNFGGEIHTAEEQAQARREATVILHCVLGVITEAAEMAEAIYKVMFTKPEDGKPAPVFDAVNMTEESGDAKWYLANLARVLGNEWDQDERVNIDKLRARFPEKFSNERANERDLSAERSILENGGLPESYREALSKITSDERDKYLNGEFDGFHSAEELDAAKRDLFSERAALANKTEAPFVGSGHPAKVYDPRAATQFEGMGDSHLRDGLGLPLEGTVSVPKTPQQRAADAARRDEK